MVAPIASASAALPEARVCTFEGEVTFPEGGKLGAVPKQLKYKFDSKAIPGGVVGNKCTEGAGTVPAKAEVKGTGLLSCVASNGLVPVGSEVTGEGSVTIETPTPKVYKIPALEFKFVGATAVLLFTAKGVNTTTGETFTAVGQANFAKNASVLAKCAGNGGAGEVESLLFEASALAAII
jgi:hypothetical protein